MPGFNLRQAQVINSDKVFGTHTIRRLVDSSLERAKKQATRRAISRLSSADQIALAEAATNPPAPNPKLRAA